MNQAALVRHAMELLRGDVAYLLDARQGVLVSNTVVGSVMSITLGVPRQYTEAAVRKALQRFDGEG